MFKLLITLSLGFLLLSCGGNSTNDNINGVCVINYEDPLITITRFRSSSNDIDLLNAQISNITLDNSEFDISNIDLSVSKNIEIDLDNNFVWCHDIPCGLFTHEGVYAFDIVSRGSGDPIRFTTSAKYGSFVSGCPATYSNGIEIEILPQKS